MKNSTKKILAFLLCFEMILSLACNSIPVVYAAESSDYRQNITKQATFDPTYTQFPIVGYNPAGIPTDDVLKMDYVLDVDTSVDLVVEIVDVCTADDGLGYWYQIKAADGYALPANFPAEPWVFQNRLDYDFGASLIIQERPACEICGKTNCSTNHVYCEICKKYDCGKTHTVCNICG